ncbi:MAG: aminopeptidase P N-terminal domain-containing protein, partial [Bacteroidales bacterium]|nr:aminopeptidase P N-terminal domain-containing protein [Bacteroidales bacterium]
MKMFSQEVYKTRRAKLKAAMKSGVCIFMGNNEAPMNYPDNCYQFRQDSSFLYFFGIAQAGLKAIIDVDNDRDIIFGDELTIDDIVWTGEVASIRELASKCGVTDVRTSADFVKYVESATAKVHYLPPYRHDNMIFLSKLLHIDIDDLQKNSSLQLVKAVINLRNIKEACEIEELQNAAAIGYEMHTTAMKMAKEGVSEHEIYGAIEGISLKHGLLTSFHSIVSKNGQILHNHTHQNILHNGDLLLNDSGAQTDMGYASDNTRTFPVGGKFTQRQKDVYQIVLNTINGSIPLMKPGETYLSIHLKASEILTKGLIDLGLMKGDIHEAVQKGAHALFMPHG